MARGDWKSSDFDGKPGSSTSSRSYDRIFDRRGESEISMRPETSIQILQNVNRERAAAEAAADARQRAQSRVHVFQGVGKFIIPLPGYENTWAAHAEMIKDRNLNLYFNPEKFPYFDQIIAEKLGDSPIVNPNHRDYAKYEDLRTNLAVLRNDIIGIKVDDGSFDPEDVVHIPAIAGIATAIADGLKNDTWLRRPFAPYISKDVANVEAVGAREVYKHLLAQQSQSWGKILEPIRSRFKELLGIADVTWGLPPIEATPFSDQGLSAAPPPHRESYTAEELTAACAKENNGLVTLCDKTIGLASDTLSLETLRAPDRETSASEARKLFRFLRNLQHGDADVETWMGAGTPVEQVTKAESLHRLIEIYAGELHKMTRARPESFYNIAIEDASEAAGGFALGMAVHTANSLPPASADVKHLDGLIDAMPEVWDQRSQQSVNRLLATLEAGLRHTMGADVSDKSAADRLVEFSENIRNTAQRIRRAEDMDLPAREESIELAREILRKLKNITFNDRPIDELTRGDMDSKAEFAQKIDEMSELYRNILSEAAAQNPAILQDARVQQANEAVGQFAHAVSVMAAKEIHTDTAAAQKISAEVAAMPSEWKNMDGQTVGKLASRMEEGLEQAVGELAAAQQEQQKRDEETFHEAETNHSRRRRRRRSAASGMSAGAMRKVDQDIKADDRAAGQGVFRGSSNPAPTRGAPPARPSVQLRPEDLAAVQTMSDNLRALSNAAADAAASTLAVVDVKAGDKIVPDDKGAASFVDQTRDQRRPGNRDAHGNRQGGSNPVGSGTRNNNPNNQRPTRT